MVALLLLGFFLRVYRIGQQRVWWDEGWSVWAARFSPLDILRQTGNDVHPPLYFDLLHLWRALSGDEEGALRLLSAFLGLLAVALTYALGRRTARGNLSPDWATAAGLLAALLLAVSRFAVAWSQEIRMYALAMVLALLAVWAARRVWQRGRRGDAALYVAATAAGLYTLYLFAPVWLAINAAWLWEWRAVADRRRELWRWAALQLLVVALFLPWVLYAAGGFLNTASATPIRPLDFLHIYWTVLTVGIPVDVAQFNRLTLPALGVFLLAVGALVARPRTARSSASADRRPPKEVTSDDSCRPTRRRATSTESTAPSSGSLNTDLLNTDLLNTDSLAPSFRGQRSAVRGHLRDLTLLLSILLLPALIVYFISLPRQNFYNPPFNPRYLVIFTPFYSILLAWGLAALGESVNSRSVFSRSVVSKLERRASNSALVARRSTLVTSGGGRRSQTSGRSAVGGLLALVLSAFMLAVALVGLRPYHPGRVLIDDYPSLVSTIEAYRRSGDAVVLYSDTDWPIFAYHHPAEWRGVPGAWAVTPELAADFLTPIWEEHDAIWLVTTPYGATGDPQRHVPAWLAEKAMAVREFTYKDMALTLFTRTAERAATADQLTGSGPANRLDVPLPGSSTLVGYEQAAHDFKSGDIIHLFLYRQGGAAGHTEVGLIDAASSNVWGTTPIEWPAGADLSRQQVDILVPPEAPSGDYRFYVIDVAGASIPFGGLTVRQRQTPFLTLDDVTITNPVEAQFGDAIRLQGYDLAAPTVRPGETVGLTLYWTADGDVGRRYKVFTHLLGDVFNATTGNFLWGQVDSEPAANTRPTTTWRGAEVIIDEYAIPLAADAPPGTYRIEIGLYDAASGERLPLLGPDGAPVADHLILTVVEVE